MAELLKMKGSFRILSDDLGSLSSEETNALVKTAGTTCYQARETSKRTPEEFVKMAQKSGHFSVLEHSWRTVEIDFDKTPKGTLRLYAYELFQANNLFCITERTNSLLVSGNSRMFNEALAKVGKQGSGLVHSISCALHDENPVLFHSGFYEAVGYKIIIYPALRDKKEILVHRAMTVEFNDCSRGFTHETVRSRNGDQKIASYSQESTRYVDYARGEENLDEFQIKFILPYSGCLFVDKAVSFSVDGGNYSFTPQQFTNLMEGWYRVLRKKVGLKPEEARQWLPIGIKAQIVQTYNLNEWRHWFLLRTQSAAHPEIRFIAVNLLKEAQKRIPNVFDDFFVNTSEGNYYALYKGDDPLA